MTNCTYICGPCHGRKVVIEDEQAIPGKERIVEMFSPAPDFKSVKHVYVFSQSEQAKVMESITGFSYGELVWAGVKPQ